MTRINERESLTFIDFFSGIGGFRRGMELAGHKCVGFCEWDKYATASYTSMHLITDEQRERLAKLPLKQRQKEILNSEYRNGEWYADDIRTVHADDLPRADVWCFGAPCQDFSIAGKRKGLDGDRSSLVREIFRLLDETDSRGGIDLDGCSTKMLRECFRQTEDLTTLPFSLKWTSAGMIQNGRFWTVNGSECRNTGKECSLSDVLEKDVSEKYYLSETVKKQLKLYKDSQLLTL